MFQNLQVGRVGLDAFQKKLDLISNNVANVQTIGYKRTDARFEDLLYDKLNTKGVPVAKDLQDTDLFSGLGSKIKKPTRNFELGTLHETANPLDLAIGGDGFFGVENENGDLMLTRDGSFSLRDGLLVDQQGNKVMTTSSGTLFDEPGASIKIDEFGNISTISPDGDVTDSGKIQLYNIMDKSTLQSVGNNYYVAEDNEQLLTSNAGENGLGTIEQGFLEGSNVDIGKELVEMMVTQRAYQINTKSIHAVDEMWTMVNNIKR